MEALIQHPAPGHGCVRFVGDRLRFTLRSTEDSSSLPGRRAFLRTNLGRADAARSEIITAVDSGKPATMASWRDIPLNAHGNEWRLDLPLTEVGYFRAKAYAVDDRGWQHWPSGSDLGVNVQPNACRTGNTIYCAFTRMFGPTKQAASTSDPKREARLKKLDDQGYAVIPPSGKLRDLGRELPHVFETLGCRILHLLPVNPAPTTYARFGRFGSPYACGDLLAVDPALVEFDRRTTGIDQFRELAWGVHERRGLLFLDLVVNHTGWGSTLQERHPEWFLRNEDGTFASPGAWGNTWADLVEFEHANPRLRQYLADVFLEWSRRGVDGFRCDAGYMVPLPVWQYIIARVRQEFPNAIFLLEGLGGAWEATEALLTDGGMQWAYSELFQNYSGSEVSTYLDHALSASDRAGLLVHYSETHDNERLAAKGRRWSLLRNHLCALTSPSGGFGFTAGVEWLAEEKVNVHSSRGLAWDNPDNVVAELARVNRLLRDHPCFFDGARLRRISPAGHQVYALLRVSAEGNDAVLVLVNTDVETPGTIEFPASELPSEAARILGADDPDRSTRREDREVEVGRGVAAESAKRVSDTPRRLTETVRPTEPTRSGERAHPHDLLSDTPPPLDRSVKGKIRIRLEPGACGCLATTQQPVGEAGPDYRDRKAAEALALRVVSYHVPPEKLGEFDLKPAARWLAEDPFRFLASATYLDGSATLPELVRTLKEQEGSYPRVVRWQLKDARRVLPVPPDHWLLIEDEYPFRAALAAPDQPHPLREASIRVNHGHIACFVPRRSGTDAVLSLERFASEGRHVESSVRYLGDSPSGLSPVAAASEGAIALLTNGIGGMSRLGVDLGAIRSKYDCLLAANLDPRVPVDRHVFVKRARVWVNADGFLSPLNSANLLEFTPGPPARWRFLAHAGDDRVVEIALSVSMEQGRNHVVLRFERPVASSSPGRALPPEADVRLTVRLDLEDRNFHTQTKRKIGADRHLSRHCRPVSRSREDGQPVETATPAESGDGEAFAGFDFTPAPDRTLKARTPSGWYHPDPEWREEVPHPVEASRGQTGSGDAFSPGWFELPLAQGSTVEIGVSADRDAVSTETGAGGGLPRSAQHDDSFEGRLLAASRAFVVKRDDALTVIAGYPWFLDWGRDTLICARGLLAGGMKDEVLQVLKVFGRFEDHGTLPNTIHGEDASNRDTSDAPLWYGIVCEEYAAEAGVDSGLYRTPVATGGRTLAEVLRSIASGYIRGTANGIRMDPESALIWSPSHFTWMDTNHPAGTPREGYPIEIQALWVRLLEQLGRLNASPETAAWTELADRARGSLERLFWLEDCGYYADVLIGKSGISAANSVPHDALRSNCLLPIALGLTSGKRAQRCLENAVRYLVVPGALRSLAPLPVHPPLPVRSSGGQSLNDPERPYWGRYEGDEDTRRKPAYHNGTAWIWTFPAFCEAVAKAWAWSPEAVAAARSWLGSTDRLLREGCIGHLPEIVDGDAPHAKRGCDAQAWSATETLRVWKLLSQTHNYDSDTGV